MAQTKDSASGPRPLKRLAKRIEQVETEYSQGDARPLGGYLGVIAGYAVFTGAGVAVTRFTRRTLPVRVEPVDLAQVAMATFQLGRLLTKKPVTSPLRAPFTVFGGASGAAEVHEEVRGEGIRHAV